MEFVDPEAARESKSMIVSRHRRMTAPRGTRDRLSVAGLDLEVVRRGEGHHVRHWANGGPTTLSNLALLCRRHHRAVHEEGYQVEREADATLRFRRPDGRLLPEVPPPIAVPADPVQALRTQHEGQGLHLHARTTRPGWLGERLDVGYAIDVVHPLANRAARPRLSSEHADCSC